MSEETKEKKGFFSEIKTQIIGVITLVLTTGGTLIVTHMEQLFGVDKKEEKTEVSAPVTTAAPVINITNTNQQSQQVSGGKTIIIKEKVSPSQPTPAVVVKPKKTETEKRKEEGLDW
jgi:hypothetical protein